MPTMNPFRTFCVAIAMAGAAPRTASAQDYPTKPIRLIIPTAAGGLMDVAARVAVDYLSKSLGQRLVIENRTGSGGNLGTEVVVKAEPDGYTLGLVQLGNVAINPHVYADMTFDPLNDLVPVAPMTSSAILVVPTPRCRPTICANSSRSPRTSPASSPTARPGPAPRRISPARCSSRRRASTSCMCLIAARVPR